MALDALPVPAARLDPRTALDQARFGLARTRPELSTHRTFTRWQAICGFTLIAGAGWAAWTAPQTLWQTVLWGAFALFTAMIALRLAAAAASLSPPQRSMRRWAHPLPAYTLLCPLFKEADVIADLVAAIQRLDYPHDKLDVKLVLEEDDVETIAVAEALDLPLHFEIIIVPSAEPETKPKALNYALAFARGEFVAIYDAEDCPHPHQLKAALDAFAAGGEQTACVQAPLLAHNGGARWISAQFAAEYAVQFGAILPFLARLGLPLPLGGTSNHFRVTALRESGGWDPYNVTEDADLGYRLARDGWRTGMIAPPTREEAPVSLAAWRRQRTRWIKGHMQTWLVLMRDPLRTAREMGLAAFASLQLLLFGGVLAAFLHGPVAIVLLADIFLPIDILGPTGLALAIGGYATALYCAIATSAMLNDWRIAAAAATMPLYWPLASIAAFAALGELFTKPHYWDKTEHGLSARRGV